MTQPHSVTETGFAKLMSKIRESERTLDAMYRKAADLETLLRGSANTRLDVSIKLPVEVLGMIFREVIVQSDACMDYHPSPFESDQPEWPVTRPELLVSHVSRYWRAVAIATPSLWTYIRLYVEQSVDLVDLYLSRSRGLPLFIAFRQHFVCGTHPRQAYSAEYPRIIATILDHMHICRRLEIRTNVAIPELLDGLGRSRAPLLKEIVLHHPRSGIREHMFSFSSFPTLTHLELGQLMSISTTMPIKTLTSLTLDGLPSFGLPAATFLNLLSGLQSLSRLALLDEAVDFDRSHTTDVVEMPSLRCLILKPGPDISRIYLTGLIQMVITPELEELVLDFTSVSSPREIHLFLRYLKREAPRFLSLRDITINSPFDGFDITSAFVHAAPNINGLSLSRYNIDSVLTYLTHDARQEAFPKLRTLQFESPHFDWDVVLSFLRKRKQLGRPLHCLKFKGFGGSKGEVLDGLFDKLLEACLAV
ncbi:hypothetical protein JVT61DRAFT_3030 [Boletus reticuloceps]|uniref:F-box domain-containing protein n=1 Tax=Boletus reticuloceps TaxID=495285 RepID=A0A8I2YRE2_9AGAM|nr:hypothetical protein JVT61DRAFT_3030 [Boletus reticuloceps]